MQKITPVLLILICLICTPVNAAAVAWNSLDNEQKEALSPLSKEWESLPDLQQHRLLNTAKRYHSLTPDQKTRFHSRLEAWSKLTPEQRKAAREKYRAFNKLHPKVQTEIKHMIRKDMQAKSIQPASGVMATLPVLQ
jgi:predicted Fe-S protein YdhL (DUF1289 family)